jgi:biotin transport system substrate-specific component
VSENYSHAVEPAVLSDFVVSRWVREGVMVLGAASLVGLSAQLVVPVPGTPVPVTGQTLAVLLCGAALGARRAALSMVLYLAVGAAGVGWFAEGTSGTGHPSFGYVVGFILAAGVVGYLAGRGGDRTPARTVLTMTVGTLLIYAVGVPWLAFALDVDLWKAMDLGLWPFLIGDALKVVAAAGLLPLSWLAVRHLRED